MCCAHQHGLGRWRSPTGCTHKHTRVHTHTCTLTRAPARPWPVPAPSSGCSSATVAPLAQPQGCFRTQPKWSPPGHRGHSPWHCSAPPSVVQSPASSGCREGPIQPGGLHQGSAVSPFGGLGARGHTCLHFQAVEVVFLLLLLACTQNREQPSAWCHGAGTLAPWWRGERAPTGGSPGHGGGPIAASIPGGSNAPSPHPCRGLGQDPGGQLRGGQGKRSPAGFLCYQPISRAAGTRKPLPGKQLKITRPFLGLQTLAELEATE